jgi:Lhr-like helicase
MGSTLSCGLARSRNLVGRDPTRVIVSSGPGIQPCSQSGNRVMDA